MTRVRFGVECVECAHTCGEVRGRAPTDWRAFYIKRMPRCPRCAAWARENPHDAATPRDLARRPRPPWT